MRVFISGAGGFIGSHLAEVLLARGDEVAIIDNFSTGRKENLDGTANNRKMTLWALHIQGEGTMNLVSQFKPDVVIHCAAAYKDPDDWRNDIQTNVLGTAQVIRAAKSVKCERFIYLQTALCYGLHPHESPVTLSHPLNPQVSYAISKTAGEQYIMNSKLDWVSFRLANAYGPRNLSGAPPTWYKRLSEEQPVFAVDARRDMVFIDDIVRLVMMAVDGKGSGVYHASSGTDYAMQEVLEALLTEMKIRVPYEVKPRAPEDAPTLLLDPSRTVQDFGWEPIVKLNVGIRKAVGWYKQHPIKETYTHLSRYGVK